MKLLDLIRLIDGKLNNISSTKKNINSFKLDSRSITNGDVFIAINKGYLYIEDAINNGAICIITDKDIRLKTKVCIIKVEDMSEALLKIVTYIRGKYSHIPVIAITGSVGKTTTKELLSDILSTNYKILKNDGSKNNYIGISETMFKLNNDYDIVILEVGMNHLNEIEKISKAIKPNISAITNIGTSHIGNLGSIKNILKAKLEIVSGMDNGRLVIPYIDKRLRHLKYDDINKCNDIKIRNIHISDNLSFILKYHNKEYNINFNIPNKAYISNILIAFEIATYFMIDIDSIINSINNYRNMKSRMDIIKKGKYTVINDTYNSSYESIKGVLNYLKQLDTNKLVILGDIKELGKYSIKIHKRINKLLKGIYKENILLVGKYTSYIKGIHFNNNEDIINYLKEFNLNNYTILVKGSRAMHMEEIVDFLKK